MLCGNVVLQKPLKGVNLINEFLMKMEKMGDIIYNKWIECSDSNYWQTDYDIVACRISDEVFIFSRNECPYGWNVLCDSEGKIFTPEFPKFD